MASQSASWWQGGKGRWPSELQERNLCSIKEGDEAKQIKPGGRTLKGMRVKGRSPSALCISDVKNKLYLHLGGGGVQSAWCCVGAVWERGLGHLCTTLPQGWEGGQWSLAVGFHALCWNAPECPAEGAATQEKHFAQLSGRDVECPQ